MIWPLFRYILMAAGRDRIIFSILGVIAIVISLAFFFGASVITEQDNFARTFAAYSFRLFGVAIIVLFTVNYIRRSFEGRDVDYLLSRPVGRVRFILTHAAAFSFIAAVAALLLGGTSMVFELRNLTAGALLWWLSLAVEFIIMANVAMFFAFVLSSPTICMIATFAFYLLCRLIGEILGILDKATNSRFLDALGSVMEVISVFIPRLDMMGQSKWILYGVQPEISLPFVLGQGAVFVALVITASVIDMHRRQF